jgi:ribosomal protein S18 acetylase RimI-like enzyme
LRIIRARSAREVADFARVQAANWDPPDPLVVRFYELAAAVLLSGDCPLRLYVGYLGAEPVAASEATRAGGVVGLYNVATRREFRRRGFGAALTAWPLRDGRAQGDRTAVLQAASEGVRLYERIGFRRYGDITEYKPGI